MICASSMWCRNSQRVYSAKVVLQRVHSEFTAQNQFYSEFTASLQRVHSEFTAQNYFYTEFTAQDVVQGRLHKSRSMTKKNKKHTAIPAQETTSTFPSPNGEQKETSGINRPERRQRAPRTEGRESTSATG